MQEKWGIFTLDELQNKTRWNIFFVASRCSFASVGQTGWVWDLMWACFRCRPVEVPRRQEAGSGADQEASGLHPGVQRGRILRSGVETFLLRSSPSAPDLSSFNEELAFRRCRSSVTPWPDTAGVPPVKGSLWAAPLCGTGHLSVQVADRMSLTLILRVSLTHVGFCTG